MWGEQEIGFVNTSFRPKFIILRRLLSLKPICFKKMSLDLEPFFVFVYYWFLLLFQFLFQFFGLFLAFGSVQKRICPKALNPNPNPYCQLLTNLTPSPIQKITQPISSPYSFRPNLFQNSPRPKPLSQPTSLTNPNPICFLAQALTTLAYTTVSPQKLPKYQELDLDRPFLNPNPNHHPTPCLPSSLITFLTTLQPFLFSPTQP